MQDYIIRPFATPDSERITIPSDESEFSYFFKPILSYTDNLYWLCLSSSFKIPYEWYDNSVYFDLLKIYLTGPMRKFYNCFKKIKGGLSKNSLHLLGSPGAISKYKLIINDDWNRLLGFRIKPSNIVNWIDNYWKLGPKERAAYIGDWIDLGISNCDGAYWEVYTEHKEIIEQLQKYWGTIKGLRVEEGDLETSYGI